MRVRDIAHAVSFITGVSVTEIYSHRRAACIIEARHVCMWIARNFTLMSLPQIGRALGKRDHTSVLHAVRKIQSKVDQKDQHVCDLIAATREILRLDTEAPNLQRFYDYEQALQDAKTARSPDTISVYRRTRGVEILETVYQKIA